MEHKTLVTAEPGTQELDVTREFDLPVELLFKAYVEPDILEQWMGTNVLKLENKQHGGYQFETTDAQGKPVFQAHGVIHDFIPNEKITRTFEMMNTPFSVQLEFMEFAPLTAGTSKLTLHVVYRSAAQRDQLLQMGFAPGINMAHNRLQDVAGQLR